MKNKLTGLLIAGALFAFSGGKSAEVSIDEVKDFKTMAAQMEKEKLVLVLEFHAKHCSYCKQLEEEILRPMLLSGDYNDLVLIKQLALDSENAIKGFDGKLTSGVEMGKKLNIIVTPTLVFLNSKGEEISERIVGINTPEMFGAYVDAAIEEGQKTLPNYFTVEEVLPELVQPLLEKK